MNGWKRWLAVVAVLVLGLIFVFPGPAEARYWWAGYAVPGYYDYPGY